MSTIYTFHRECASLATPATGDRIMTADISDNASHPTAQDMTLAIVKSAARGTATTDLIGFYGATPVDQGTMTATCLTALTTNPTFSASNTGAGVFGFSSSTVATAYVTRIQQMQVDFDTLMGKINSTGLVNITGL
jgi:hypothetical protein